MKSDPPQALGKSLLLSHLGYRLEETEAQRGEATCPMSHRLKGQGLQLDSPMLKLFVQSPMPPVSALEQLPLFSKNRCTRVNGTNGAPGSQRHPVAREHVLGLGKATELRARRQP